MTSARPKRKPRLGVDEYGRTPLHHACSEGDVSLVGRLLHDGANPNALDDRGLSPLHFAAQNHSVAIARALLKHGAEVDSVNVDGNTPLFIAVFNSKGRGALITLLLDAGARRNRKNTLGISPLQLARKIANYDVKRFFAESVKRSR